MSDEESYLKFLKEHQLEIDEVLPLVPPGLLQQPLIEIMTTVAECMDLGRIDNVNWLVRKMHEQLTKKLSQQGLSFRVPVFAGVFPLQSFNAKYRPDHGLILLHNRLFEFCELAARSVLAPFEQEVHSFDECRLNGIEFKAIVFAWALLWQETDRKKVIMPNLVNYDGPSFEIAELVNAAEQFVLLHEYRHVLDGSEVVVSHSEVARKHEEEAAADLFALKFLLDTYWGDDKDGIDITASGPFLFLWIVRLTEYARGRLGKRIPNDYPSPDIRIRMLGSYCEENGIKPGRYSLALARFMNNSYVALDFLLNCRESVFWTTHFRGDKRYENKICMGRTHGTCSMSPVVPFNILEKFIRMEVAHFGDEPAC